MVDAKTTQLFSKMQTRLRPELMIMVKKGKTGQRLKILTKMLIRDMDQRRTTDKLQLKSKLHPVQLTKDLLPRKTSQPRSRRERTKRLRDKLLLRERR